ncbi:hypothetical protein HKX48_000405 [Thoreauomyces humboldtii]|nr:hypothetical protein HKX48_000405 [Thoreauomyces humboldtii]
MRSFIATSIVTAAAILAVSSITAAQVETSLTTPECVEMQQIGNSTREACLSRITLPKTIDSQDQANEAILLDVACGCDSNPLANSTYLQDCFRDPAYMQKWMSPYVDSCTTNNLTTAGLWVQHFRDGWIDANAHGILDELDVAGDRAAGVKVYNFTANPAIEAEVSSMIASVSDALLGATSTAVPGAKSTSLVAASAVATPAPVPVTPAHASSAAAVMKSVPFFHAVIPLAMTGAGMALAVL